MVNPNNRVASYVSVLSADQLALVDEGNYFTVNNNQSGLATGATDTAYSSTVPFILIYNKAAAGGPNIYLDYLTLLATAAGNAGASVQAAGVVDTGGGNRYTSGGTELTAQITNPNGLSGQASVARVFCGNIVSAAGSTSARQVFGNRYLSGAIPVAGDTYTLKFGGNEQMNQISKQTITFTSQAVPKMVIPPNATGIINVWLPSQTGASSFAPELGWVER